MFWLGRSVSMIVEFKFNCVGGTGIVVYDVNMKSYYLSLTIHFTLRLSVDMDLDPS